MALGAGAGTMRGSGTKYMFFGPVVGDRSRRGLTGLNDLVGTANPSGGDVVWRGTQDRSEGRRLRGYIMNSLR